MGSKERMPGKNIKVAAYAGYKGEECPRAFIVDGEEIDALEIVDRWIEEEAGGRRQKRYFTVKGSDGSVHTLSYDPVLMEWFYRKKKRQRGA
jgi:hypothetical protein